MTILTQEHTEEGRLGQTEVTGIDVKVEDENRGEQEVKKKVAGEVCSKGED